MIRGQKRDWKRWVECEKEVELGYPAPEVAVRGRVAITTGAAATGMGTGPAASAGASGSEVASGSSSDR
jgi:hypothetical protein